MVISFSTGFGGAALQSRHKWQKRARCAARFGAGVRRFLQDKSMITPQVPDLTQLFVKQILTTE
ncbi:MAG TPA: hypothetical protein VIL88_06835 [Devosia sp.]|jgi:hypothetical protein|uniref:hypothetical protein n=1 Tax=Devosia sp. TaxID=1871048 RepID=UPI002F91F5D4